MAAWGWERPEPVASRGDARGRVDLSGGVRQCGRLDDRLGFPVFLPSAASSYFYEQRSALRGVVERGVLRSGAVYYHYPVLLRWYGKVEIRES